MLELSRYIVLNPVRALIVNDAIDWPWSSYACTIGPNNYYPWLNMNELLSYFGNTARGAKSAYAAFVREGASKNKRIWNDIKNQIYLGSERFVSTAMDNLKNNTNFNEVPKKHYVKDVEPLPIKHYNDNYPSRDESIYYAYQSGNYTLKEIGQFFGLHYSRVSKIVKENGKN